MHARMFSVIGMLICSWCLAFAQEPAVTETPAEPAAPGTPTATEGAEEITGDIISPTEADIRGFVYEEKLVGSTMQLYRIPYPLPEKQEIQDKKKAEISEELVTEGFGAGENLTTYAEWELYWRNLENWQRYIEESLLARPLENQLPEDLFETGLRDDVYIKSRLLWNQHQKQAIEINEQDHELLLELFTLLQQKKADYDNYQAWLEERLNTVREFSQEWVKRIRGERLNIDGTVFLVYPVPPEEEMEGTVPIVTDKVTPYDLLDDSGKLLEPVE